jgi:L-gulonolactone oxidase
METTFALLRDEARARRYPINMAVQLRMLGPDDALLSPTLGRPSIAIECVTALGTPHGEAFLRRFAEVMAERHGGRPHWAKQFFDTAALSVYGERRAAFARIQRTFDPDGVFVNELCREILGEAHENGKVA